VDVHPGEASGGTGRTGHGLGRNRVWIRFVSEEF
jgi:hypothetical protein